LETGTPFHNRGRFPRISVIHYYGVTLKSLAAQVLVKAMPKIDSKQNFVDKQNKEENGKFGK
jgi:hypothetical protein